MLIPPHFNFTTLNVLEANGSSITGGCSSVRLNLDGTSTCLTPTSSVLFDGVIPTLTALDENTWASQLMTLYKSQFSSSHFQNLHFDFATPGFRIGRVEVTIFNCPQWGTGVEEVGVYYFELYYRFITRAYTDAFSCDSLVKVCIPVNTSSTLLHLQFGPRRGHNRVHIAEVSLYESSSPCPPFTIIPGNWSAPETQSKINVKPRLHNSDSYIANMVTYKEQSLRHPGMPYRSQMFTFP